MKFDRHDLIKTLRIAELGVGKDDWTNQDCFIFDENRIVTFNGSIFTEQESPIELKMSIPASNFMKILEKFPDETLEIKIKKDSDGEMLIVGKNRKVKLNVRENKPVMEVTGDFTTASPMPDNLCNMMYYAAKTCDTPHNSHPTKYVHVAPDRVEGTDGYRVFRSVMDTTFPDSVLFPKEIVLKVLKIGGDGEQVIPYTAYQKEKDNNWFWFFATERVKVAVLTGTGGYISKAQIDGMITPKDHETVIVPESIMTILDRSLLLNSTEDMPGGNKAGWKSKIQVSLDTDKMSINSQKFGEGTYEETEELTYSGNPISFYINPVYMKIALSFSERLLLWNSKLKVENDGIEYTVLTIPVVEEEQSDE